MSITTRALTHALATALAATCFTLPSLALAADNAAAVCSVSVDYVRNNVIGHAYRQDFVVQEGAPFADDFSSPTRVRQFNASVSKANGDLVVAIDYLNDVGVFLSIGFNTALTLRGGGAAQSTSGSHSTYISNLAAGVGGTHTTNYTLSCRRA